MTVIETPAPSAQGPSAEVRYSFVEDRPDHVARWTTLALLLATAALYLIGLSASGYANSFYSAAAQAGSQDLTAWFFGSLDAGNSITVDKPPAAIWLMALSVRLFGLSSWSILVPEALLGVAGVGVLYATLRRTLTRWAGAGTSRGLTPRGAHWAALLGAFVFAVTPVATLMFRFNNPDALLVFTMLLAAYATTRASEHASRGWLALAGVAIGLGFLTKMLQAFLVLPALVVAYAVAAPATWRRKLVDLLVAFATMVVSFGWYVAVVELTPASARPYIGGSQSNSILELIVSYNGLGRITGEQVGSVGGGNGWGETGLTRLFDGVSGGMVAWLIPAALILGFAAVAGLVQRRLAGAGPAAPSSPDAGSRRALAAGLAIWLGWLVVTGGVFSLMEGIYHDYYTIALAPAIGGAVGLGAAALWADSGRAWARITLAATTMLTGVWALVLLQRAGDWYQALGWAALAGSLVAGGALLAVHRLGRVAAATAVWIGVAAASLGPVAYAVDTAATPHTGSIVTAGPVSGEGRGGMPAGRGQGPQGQPGSRGPSGSQGRPGGQGQGQPGGPSGSGQQPPTSPGSQAEGGGAGGLLDGARVSEELAILLGTDASSYTWVAATVGAQNAASYQLATGRAVMAIGGFNGTDPSPTLAEFQQDVADGRIHYFIAGGVGGRANGGSSDASQIASWVAGNYTATTVGGTTVYDLTAT